MKKVNSLSNCNLHLTTILLLITVIQQTNCQDFSSFAYDGSLGPSHWGEQFQTCDGKFQSPINIDILNVEKDKFPPIKLNGFDKQALTADLANNGHTVMVTMDYAERPTITGGPMEEEYTFAQYHFHWGDNDTFGSEDLINNRSFPLELHIVFYKSGYDEFYNALKFPDGLVVLAYFYELTDTGNEHYEDFTSQLRDIIQPGSHTRLLSIPLLKDLISNDTTQYFTYTGSLTTPPCSEVVTWIDFTVPISISSDQVTRFRELYSHDGHHLLHNFRPPQPLNGRIVYQNIPYFLDYAVVPSDIDQYDVTNDIIHNTKGDELDEESKKAKENSSTNILFHVSPHLLLLTLAINRMF